MLHSLLTASRQFSAKYGDGASNHLPMALLALARLGASDDRLREFAAFYQRRLRPKPSDEPPLPGGDWQSARGKPLFEATLSRELAKEVQARRSEAVLREVVPALTPGIASEAFHGLIRTAYAADSGDDADIADALTSWIIGYAELGSGEGHRPFDRAADAFAVMHGDERFPKDLQGRSISGRIAKVAALPAFDDYRSAIRNVELRDLATIAVSIYLATEDFTALHLVTACHATRLLEPYLTPAACDHLATAMLAAYAAIGRPAFDLAIQFEPATPDWQTLSARAIESDDDHDLKLVYSCREEDAAYGWGLHRMAAALRLSRRPTV